MINNIYKNTHDAEEILQFTFDEIQAQSKREENRDIAEIDYESALAMAIKSHPTATGAKDVAKCNPNVIDKRTILLEYQRQVDAGKRILDWLENSHQWEKLKWKKLNGIGG